MAKALKKAKVSKAYVALKQVARRKQDLETRAECVNMFQETVDERAVLEVAPWESTAAEHEVPAAVLVVSGSV